MNKQCAPVMSELLTASSDVPSKASLRSSNNGDFVVPATRLRLGDRAFSVAAARVFMEYACLLASVEHAADRVEFNARHVDYQMKTENISL